MSTTEEALRAALQAIVDDHDRRVTPDWMGRIAAARAALALPTSTPPVPTVSETDYHTLRAALHILYTQVKPYQDGDGAAMYHAQRIARDALVATGALPRVPTESIPGYEPPATLAEAAQIVIEYAEQFMEDWASDEGMDKESRADCDAAQAQLEAAIDMLRTGIDPALATAPKVRAAIAKAEGKQP